MINMGRHLICTILTPSKNNIEKCNNILRVVRYKSWWQKTLLRRHLHEVGSTHSVGDL